MGFHNEDAASQWWQGRTLSAKALNRPSFEGAVILAAVVMTALGIPSLHYSTRAWIAVAEQGLLATASTTVLWNWGLKRVPASQAGIFVNLEPLVGAALGVFLLHEVLGRIALAGGALIIGEPFISVTSRRPLRVKSRRNDQAVAH